MKKEIVSLRLQKLTLVLNGKIIYNYINKEGIKMINYDVFNTVKTRMKSKFPILLTTYLKKSKTYLAAVHVNLPDGDMNTLIDATHSMKSASGVLGITDVHRAAERLEYAAKDLVQGKTEDRNTLLYHYAGLRDQFSKIEDTIQDELKKAQNTH